MSTRSCVKHKLKPIIWHIGTKNFKVDGLYHIYAPTKHHVTGRTPPASTAFGQLQCSCLRVGQRGIMGHEKGAAGRAQRFISCEAMYIKHAGQLLACTSCVTPIPRPINYPSKPSWTCWCTRSCNTLRWSDKCHDQCTMRTSNIDELPQKGGPDTQWWSTCTSVDINDETNNIYIYVYIWGEYMKSECYIRIS